MVSQSLLKIVKKVPLMCHLLFASVILLDGCQQSRDVFHEVWSKHKDWLRRLQFLVRSHTEEIVEVMQPVDLKKHAQKVKHYLQSILTNDSTNDPFLKAISMSLSAVTCLLLPPPISLICHVIPSAAWLTT